MTFLSEVYKPDVLSCIANLSSDEVFTPPDVANKVLDMLPQELFTNPKTKFLDPCCKSGVFLREIAKRLIAGLEKEIPDLEKRLEHIFKKQLFGIAITELTGLLSRRSVYCSKHADSEFSTIKLDDAQGNIIYKRINHIWFKGRCIMCGASQEQYSRGDILETHAYQFIHTNEQRNKDELKRLKNMKFDVIIGNPPYQLSDGGNAASAKPLYHLFVEQAKKLNPRYMTMIIPARWYAGGKGLDSFRDEMLKDNSIRKLVDYFDSTECFPGVDISGGICYFLWDKDNKGDCEIKTIRGGNENTMTRPLLEGDSEAFVRFHEAITILKKVEGFKEGKLIEQISSRKPFGIDTTIQVGDEADFTDPIKIYAYPKNGYISKRKVPQNKQGVSDYKVLIAYAYGERGAFPYLVTGKSFLAEPNSCCSETYIVLGSYKSENEAINLISYSKTRLFRFLVLLKKNTQHATKKAYSFVPLQDFHEEWTDEKLYIKYGITEDEIAFIESMVRPME